MSGILGERTLNVGVTVDEANIAFTKNNLVVKVTEDTVDPTNNIAQPVGTFLYIDGVQHPVSIDTVDPANNFTIPVNAYTSIDGVEYKTNIDTATPANSIVPPVGMYIVKDGVQYQLTKDTVDPNNTVAMPVEIVGSDGAIINITAGDINVQTSHAGVNYDSMRIGDGTNLMSINADLEALVNDVKLLAYFDDRLDEQAKVDSISTTMSTEDLALITSIYDELAKKSKVGNILSGYSSAIVTTTGLTVGTIPVGTPVYKANLAWQAGVPIEITIGGTMLGILLAGGGADFDCNGLTGDVIVKSLTTDTAGSFAFNLMG